MNIEEKPIRQSKTYWGTINIPEIMTAEGKSDIPFTIEHWFDDRSTDVFYIHEGYIIHPIVKNSNFKPFRGKELRLLYERVLQEIKDQKLEL